MVKVCFGGRRFLLLLGVRDWESGGMVLGLCLLPALSQINTLDRSIDTLVFKQYERYIARIQSETFPSLNLISTILQCLYTLVL